jgi:cytochrome c biogenesis protein CcmG/thiol:disulfide interchange protein DsbE
VRRTFVALLALVLLAGCGAVTASSDAPRALPDATLKPLRADDRPVDLGALRGPAVINLWANWCGPCRREMPIYQQFHEKHPGVAVLGIDWRDPARDRAVAFARETGVTYPLVVDTSGEVVQNKVLPRLILVDASGDVTYSENLEIKSLAQLEKLVRTHLEVAL